MLYSHGFFSCSRDFCGISAEIASHGYVVFVMDCHSGMGVYTEKEDKTPIDYAPLWDLATQGMDYDGIKKSTVIKEEEFKEFIDELETPGYLQKKLRFPDGVNLNMDKLIMNGHSLGGGTSFQASVQNEKIKCCLAMDPYHGVTKEEDTSTWNLNRIPW
jgi:dienelactone hydrolase